MARIMTCIAFLDNDMQKDNLCTCIEILGGKPVKDKTTVRVSTEYPSDLANRIILLFEHYWRHEIMISGE